VAATATSVNRSDVGIDTSRDAGELLRLAMADRHPEPLPRKCLAHEQEQARRRRALVAKHTEQLSASDPVGTADRPQPAQNVAP